MPEGSVTDPNSALIEAVENGDADAVRAALLSGADPNDARKTVELQVQLDTGETMTDKQLMEPVLALAILVGDVQVLQLLLEAGADPDRPISWGIARHYYSWTVWRWEGERWLVGGDWMQYPSALDFALANGSDWPFNKKGGNVVLVNPSEPEHVGDKYVLIPSLDIVRLLLRQGARVTDTALEKARWMTREGSDKWGRVFPPKPEFLHLLEFHITFLKQLTKVNADLQLRLEGAQRSVKELEQRRVEADRLAAALKELKGVVLSKDARISELERQSQSSLGLKNQWNSNAKRATSIANQSVARTLGTMDLGVDAILPKPVRKLVHVLRPYVPQDTDEIALSHGDKIWCMFQFADGWCAGMNRTTTQSGYFPMMCVSLSPPDEASAISKRAQASVPARTSSSSQLLQSPSIMADPPLHTLSKVPNGMLSREYKAPGLVLNNGTQGYAKAAEADTETDDGMYDSDGENVPAGGIPLPGGAMHVKQSESSVLLNGSSGLTVNGKLPRSDSLHVMW